MSDSELEQRIRFRLEALQMPLKNVKCYSNLGVGILYLLNEKNKNTLLNHIQSVVLDVNTATIITFVEQLEFTSYLVLDTTDSGSTATLPTEDEIIRRWTQVCKLSKLPPCEQISVHFSNIYKIVFRSFNELVLASQIENFTINSYFAVIYLRADCSFLEDLPKNITTAQISEAINLQCQSQFKSSSLYIEYNKNASNAIILATNSARKWSKINHVIINGQVFQKKTHLAYRLLVHPVPRTFPIDRIIKHRHFKNAVAQHNHIGEHLIIELKDKSILDFCVNLGALKIEDHRFFLDPYAVIHNDPENVEMNAENWYETQMRDMTPDIMQFVVNPNHDVFKYKWNAKLWSEQFKKVLATRNRDNDVQRHLLRTTVMLNTIGVVKKATYKVGDIQINLKPEPLVTIVYDHQSKLKRKYDTSSIVPPYTSTTVEVINDDCIDVYNRLVARKLQPVLHNMANAKTPGGGYRKGDGAQEENLFRRSNYYLSLDAELDDTKQAQRFRCLSTCELKPLEASDNIYPIQDFGAIYTKGITVFRDTEEKGYAYLEEPIKNVAAIAMAAYQGPELTSDNNFLTSKYAVGMRKKIENLFAIAYHNKHDSLVLSAFGCGAFKNPPSHVAAIFESVIQQYAGYFKSIYFAIIDDHNTGYKINPNGNYQPFKDVFNQPRVSPPAQQFRYNMVSGPYRIINESKNDGKLTIDDVCIYGMSPCWCGAKCGEIEDPHHSRTYAHPPLCVFHGSCDRIKDKVHSRSFIHRIPCQAGGDCKDMNDQKHLTAFTHPNFCEKKGNCADTTESHLLLFRHLPLCKDGFKCVKLMKRNQNHCEAYRHCKINCPLGNHCTKFHNCEHIEDQEHPFTVPCPYTPYMCQYHVQLIQTKDEKDIPASAAGHCFRFSHVCPFGRYCDKLEDVEHIKSYIHIMRKPCPNIDRCSLITDEDHLNTYSHPKVRDIRLLCRQPGSNCRGRSDPDHMTRFRHAGNYNHIGVVRYSGLNKGIDFIRNQNEMIENIQTYIRSAKWSQSNLDVSDEILRWIRALQPVHRCNKLIFESVLVHGHVMSREHMNLLRKVEFVADAVKQHKTVRRIFDPIGNLELERTAREYIQMLVEIEFEKGGQNLGSVLPVTGASGADAATTGTPLVSSANTQTEYSLSRKELMLKVILKPEDVCILRECAIEIARASIKLQSSPTGVGFEPDKALGTNKHVFAILGPHLGHYYGDILFVFKHELMCHPDTNFSIQAATTYGQSTNAYKFRPWLKDPGTPETRIQQFHTSKLHCSIPNYEYAAAMELIALTGLKDKSTTNVNLHTIQQRWKTIDSHCVFEAHLPQLIPLDYIDQVYMAKTTFDSLSNSAQKLAQTIFGGALIITEHKIDVTTGPAGLHQPLDALRTEYQTFVVKKICETIEKRAEAPPSVWGTVITLPASKFEQCVALPITISQSHSEYLRNQNLTARQCDVTFIYWQAMRGDMMLTVTNQLIDVSTEQPQLKCLTCYIGNLPVNNAVHYQSIVTHDYSEGHSYISDHRPFMHEMIKHSQQIKASSNSFHRGCNTDDYITYCLQIKQKTGEVTLAHAGSNAIYNHEIISYKFDKTELDLTKLEYIQVSAGAQTVPIKNLVIRHERTLELHPSVDDAFKVTKKSPPLSPKTTTTASKMSHDDEEGTTTSEPSSPDNADQPSRSYVEEVVDFVLRPFRGSQSPPSKPPSSSTQSKPPSKPSSSSTPSSPHPCLDSVNCLIQYADTNEAKIHKSKYTHPCRFSELCRNKATEPHLVHISHAVSMCQYDKKCRQLNEPIHRARYRHSDYPDYLVPCRYQAKCANTSFEHRIKYSHGETIPLPVSTGIGKYSKKVKGSKICFFSAASKSRSQKNGNTRKGYAKKNDSDSNNSD
jgi:uncharacterized protein (TIGR02452 family)